MLKKWNRVLAILLAFALVFTTFGSDIASTRAFAVEGGEELPQQEIATAEWEQIPQGEEQPVAETPAEEQPVEEAPAEEQQAEEAAPVEEQAPDEAATEATIASDEAVSESSEAAAIEASTEEAADAASLASTEDAAAEASSEEEVVEEKEEKLVTVRYKASKGGSVSNTKETVNINDEEAKFEGATATPWNDKYTFVDWTDAEGVQVSTDATFVPENLEEDAVFTANFAAAEDISETMPSIEANDVHVDGMIVSVQAEVGLFPAGTEISIKSIPDEQAVATAEETLGKEINKAKGVDITFIYEGNEIQPANNKYVHVKLDIEETISADDLTVLHDHGDEVETIEVDVNKDAQGNVDTVEFDSNQFSIFIVVDPENPDDDARLEVKFMIVGETEPIASYYVKKSDLVAGTDGTIHFEDIVYDPGVGELTDGVMFRGWTSDPNYTTASDKLTIKDVRDEVEALLNDRVTEGDSVTYYAMLFKSYTVSYIDDREASLGSSEVLFRADDETEYQSYTVNMNYTPSDNNHNFEGWLVSEGKDKIEGYTEGKSYKNGAVIGIKGDVILSVDLPAGHWLVFNENGKGATYNAPQFVKSDEVTHEPCDDSAMIRNGYTFKGWFTGTESTDSQGKVTVVLGEAFEFGNALTEMTTIYAKWEAKDYADYTIIIWRQNLDGEGYDFATSVKLNGKVGDTVNAVSVQGYGNDRYVRIDGTNYNTEDYDGFHYSSNDQSSKQIAPEGNTVVNVYYDRNQHTLRFQVYDYTYTVSTGDYDNNPNKYGIVDGKHVRVYWNSGAFRTSNSSSAPVYSGTVYTRSNTRSTHTIKEITALYGQSISDQFPIVGTDGITYTAARWAPTTSNPYSYVLSYIDIMPDADVTFTKDNNHGKDLTITYYVEALPGTTEETFEFGGLTFVVYKSLQCDYNFFTEAEDYLELPGYTKYGVSPSENTWGSGGAEDVKCYYTRNFYKINFMDGAYYDGNGVRIMSEQSNGQIEVKEGILYQADVSSNNEYTPSDTPDGYVFEGWYVDNACTTKYEFDKMPEDGITVYARWRQIQYRVFLHSMADGDSTLTWGSDSQQTNFRVSYGGKVSTPTGRRNGYEFTGWSTDPAGHESFDKDAFVLNDQTVTATYDKTRDFTDPSDKWGNANANKNSDLTGNNGTDRFWITRKLDLYANWRETTTGAKGIGLIYDADGGSPAPTDTNLYADKAKAAAGAAPTTTPDITVDGVTYESRFSHWVVQKWNADANKFEDTTVTVLPGATFEVKKADARVEDAPGETNGVPNKKYTIQLRAVYVEVEKPVPTHIIFYHNYDGGVYREYTDLDVNKAVPVYGLGEGDSIPSRAGFKFRGWARENEFDENGNVRTSTDSTTLWITYDETDGYSAEQVAADEKQPYHALYAVWERASGTYKVEYYADNVKVGESEVYTVDAETPISLTDEATETQPSINAFKPDYGYKDGVQETDPYTVHLDDLDENGAIVPQVIRVDYEPISVIVTIEANSDSYVYDGTEKTVSDIKSISIKDSENNEVEGLTEEDIVLLDGSSIHTVSVTKTDVGTYSMGLHGTPAEGETESCSFKIVGENSEFFTNVKFVVTGGTLEITTATVTVTITGHNDTKTYTGEVQTVTGYDYTSSQTFYTDADFSYNGEASITETDVLRNADGSVGKYTMGLDAEKFVNNNPNVEVTFELAKDDDGNELDGWLEIDPVEVTVTIVGTQRDGVPYSGSEQVAEGREARISNDLYTENDFSLVDGAAEHAAGTTVDTYYMGLKGSDAGEDCSYKNNNDNFDVTFNVTDGYIEIVPVTDKVTVTIKGDFAEKVYNGEPVTVEDYTVVSISDDKYTEDDFSLKEGIEAKLTSTDVCDLTMGLKGSEAGDECSFVNNNANFSNVEFVVTDGYLKITKAKTKLTITADTESQPITYDGEEHTIKGITVETSNELFDVDNDLTFDYNGDGTADSYDYPSASQTEVGKAKIHLGQNMFEVTNDNFEIEEWIISDGEVEVVPRKVTVTVTGNKNEDAVYTGEEQSVTGYTISANDDLYSVEDYVDGPTQEEAEAKGTEADTYNMGLSEDSFSNTSSNFDVTFNVTDGFITISKVADAITVTITGKNNGEGSAYNGSEQTVEGYDVKIKGSNTYSEADFEFTGNKIAAGTDAGTYDMGLSEEQFKNTNENYTDVTFVVEDGYLKINPATVTVVITGNTSTVDYNGQLQSVEGFTPAVKAGTDATNSYDLANVSYDGEAKVEETNVKRENGEVAKYMMGLDVNSFKNSDPNYEVTFELAKDDDGNELDGWLEIDPVEVTVTIVGTQRDGVPYSGSEQVAEGREARISNDLYTENDFSLVDGAAEHAAGTTVDTYYMGLKGSDAGEDCSYKNNNDNFDVTFNVTDGYIEIVPVTDKVTVTIKGDFAEKVYNGEPVTVEDYTVVSISDDKYTEDDFSLKEGIEAKLTSTDVCDLTMGLKGSEAGDECSFVNNNANFSNVEFVVTDGYLKITKAKTKLTITADTESQPITYDGEEHTIKGITVETSNELFDVDNDLTFDYNGDGTADSYDYPSASQTEVGKAKIHLGQNMFEVTNDNFEIEEWIISDGEVEVVPRKVTVTVTGNKNEDAVYTGEEQSVTGYTISANDDLYSVEDYVDGPTQEEAEAKGTEADTYNMGLSEDSFSNTSSNFDVTFNVTDGFITISKVADAITVTITGKNNGEGSAYNGSEQTVEGYDVKIKGSNTYSEADFEFTGNKIAAGTDAGTYDMGLSEEQFKNTNENYTDVTFVVEDGYLKINPATVTVVITGNTSTVDYNGQLQSVEGFTPAVKAGTDATNSYDLANVSYDGEAKVEETNVKRENGEVAKYMMGLDVNSFKNSDPNYEVTFELAKDDDGNELDGWLQINPLQATVNIQGTQVTVPYDGEEHEARGWKVKEGSISNELLSAESIVTAVQFDDFVARTDKGKTEMGLKAEYFACNDENFDVTISILEGDDGYIEITPIENVVVKIKGVTATKIYNTKEQSISGYELVISDESGLYKEEYVTFDGGDLEVDEAGMPVVKGTAANTYPMGLTAEMFSNSNENFKDVTFELENDGQLVIDPLKMAITITGNTAEYSYNGKSHSAKGYTATSTVDEFDSSKVTVTGSTKVTKTDVNVDEDGNAIAYPMGLTEDMFGYDDESVEPTFEVTDGHLMINPLPITISIYGNYNTEEVIFRGYEQSVEGYTVEFKNDAAASVEGTSVETEIVTIAADDIKSMYDEKDITFTGEAIAKGILPDHYPMNLAEDQFGNKNTNFIVTFDITDGYLDITDRGEKAYEISVSSPDIPSVYNGQEQSYTIIAGVDVPESKNAVQSALDYIATVIKNFFSITAGAEDGDVPFTVTDGGVETEYVLHNAKATATGTNAGDYQFAFDETPTITLNVDGVDKNVTDQFTAITSDNLGSLQIGRAPVTITVDNASKTEGAADPDEFTGTIDGIVDGITVDVKYERAAGEAVGTYEITTTKTKEELEEEYKNYTFDITPGVFTISAVVTPPVIPDNPTPTAPTPTPTPAPTPAAPAQAVLGARREEPTGQAVLGARRARTEDETDTTRVFAIILAAAAAVTLFLTGRKKEEEEN